MQSVKTKLSLLLIAFCLLGCNEGTRTSRPDIIFILTDDLGYNDLTCYRNANPDQPEQPPTSRTPNIDRLAEEGLRFTEFYCGASVCSPSRAALLTGRNATRTGIYNWIPANSPMHLRSEEVTLAEMLREEGYQTGHFGKWHLTSEGADQPHPRDQGYDYSFFTYNNARPSHEDPVNFIRNGDPVGELQGYACQLVVDEAISWLRSREGEQPFYINIWFNEPHEKVAAPEDLAGRHTYHKDYYGSIENMDLATGRLLSFIEENGLEDNTLIIFSSDNGSQVSGSNAPLRGEKCFNYEGGVRVPFIIRWPSRVPKGKTSDIAGGFTDILPSIAGITGASLPEDRTLDGEDLSEVFLGKTDKFFRSSPIFFYRYFHDPICMLRQAKWVLLGYDEIIPYKENYDPVELAKLKPDPDKPKWSMWGFQPVHMEFIKGQEPQYFELYNIEKDPHQQNDLSEEYPEVVDQLKHKMLELKSEMIRDGGDWFGD